MRRLWQTLEHCRLCLGIRSRCFSCQDTYCYERAESSRQSFWPLNSPSRPGIAGRMPPRRLCATIAPLRFVGLCREAERGSILVHQATGFGDEGGLWGGKGGGRLLGAEIRQESQGQTGLCHMVPSAGLAGRERGEDRGSGPASLGKLCQWASLRLVHSCTIPLQNVLPPRSFTSYADRRPSSPARAAPSSTRPAASHTGAPPRRILGPSPLVSPGVQVRFLDHFWGPGGTGGLGGEGGRVNDLPSAVQHQVQRGTWTSGWGAGTLLFWCSELPTLLGLIILPRGRVLPQTRL